MMAEQLKLKKKKKTRYRLIKHREPNSLQMEKNVYFQTQPALMCLIQELCKSGNTKVFYFIDHANQVTKKFFSHYLSLVFY